MSETGGGGGGGGSGPGTIIKTVEYAPASAVIYTLSGSLVPLDTVNATIEFDVPSSGIVDVIISGYVQAETTIQFQSTFIGVGLLDHTTSIQYGYSHLPWVVATGASSSTEANDFTEKFHLASLTPGTIQIDFAAYVIGSGAAGYVIISGNTGAVSNGSASPLLIQAIESI